MRSIIRRTISRLIERGNQPKREVMLKANTLAHVIESAGRLSVIVVAGMMILSNLGFNIAPLIASAGVVGIAIGLGAQGLIKDFINGFFMAIRGSVRDRRYDLSQRQQRAGRTAQPPPDWSKSRRRLVHHHPQWGYPHGHEQDQGLVASDGRRRHFLRG
jgi:hypothetical protein